MPRINRIRVTNIKYDHGKKQLPDITIDANGLDTVMLLANGGGKTLLIQLIIQTILPNEKMGGRSISDLLTSDKYTGHVVVEWLLDHTGEQKQYLCTGFCFTSGINDDQGLRYFNYYFDYQDLSGLNIKTLPLINEDSKGLRYPISYVQLKDYLKNETKNHVRLPERKGEYQKQLRSYQILPEEWKNIRDTNGSEGGVDKFFEKSKTTQQLMDNLLIPSVEDMIFQSEEKKKELIYAFSEYRNMLIEIPLIKKNLKDFDTIRENAEGLVAEVQNLDKVQREQKHKTRELVMLAKTFTNFKDNAEKLAEELENSKQNKYHEIKKLRWQKESFGVFEKQLEYYSVLQNENVISTSCDGQTKVWQEAKEKGNRAKALQSYNKMLEAVQDVNKHQAEIAIMNKDYPELHQELKNKKALLRSAWEEKRGFLQKQLSQQEGDLDNLKEHNKQLENKLTKNREQQRNIQGALAQVDAWFNQYKKHQEKLLQYVSKTEVLEPEVAISDHQEKRTNIESREQEININIDRIDKQQVKLDHDISQWQIDKNEIEHKAQLLNEKIDQYKLKHEELQSLLAEKELYTKLLLQEKEKVWLWVQNKLRYAQENKVVKQAQVANLEEKWVLLKDKNHYIPHSELLRIKEYLQKKDIYVLLGSEWLADQQLTEQEKEAHLKHQPLLPYTIIIENSQANMVKYVIKQIKELTRDIPLLFLIKSNESLRDNHMLKEQFILLDNQLLFYQPESHRIFTSAEELGQFKERLEQQLAQIKNTVQNLIDEEDGYLQIREQVSSFYKDYNEKQITQWNVAEKEYREQMNAFHNNIENGKEKKDQLKQQLQHKKQQLENLQINKGKEIEIILKLEEYLEEFRLYSQKARQQEQYQKQLSELGQEIRLNEEQTRVNFESINNATQSIVESQRLLELHEKDYQYYQLDKTLDKILNKIDVAINYEDLKFEVDAVIKKLEQRQSHRGYVEELLTKAKEREQDAASIIESTGIDKQWLIQNKRWVSMDEVKQTERLITKEKQKYEQLKEDLQQAKNITVSVKSVLDERIHRIKNDFNMEPYLNFSKTNYKLEYENITENLIKLQEEYNKLEQSIKDNYEWHRENKEAYELITDKLEASFQIWWHKTVPLTENEWKKYKGKPKSMVRRCEKELETINGRFFEQKRVVENKFKGYLGKLESTDNPKVKQFIRDVKVIMEDDRIYNYDFVETQFLRIFEGLDKYLEQYKLTLQEREKNQQILVDLCLRRAKTVYDSIMEIPKNSRVKIYQRDIQVIKLDWRILEDNEAYKKIDKYLQQVLEDLQKWKQEGLEEDKMDRRAEDMLKTRNLIQVIAPIEDCRITVYKPRKESIVRNHKIDYSPWDEVSLWSGGEEYSIYITMFMIMISHIRQETQGNRKVWKVIVADNPFGVASSPHILETVFQVARSNKIQLICLTAHKEDSILQRFPVVYSLQLRHAYGKEVMKAEQMETGFYRYDTPTDDGAQMALLV